METLPPAVLPFMPYVNSWLRSPKKTHNLQNSGFISVRRLHRVSSLAIYHKKNLQTTSANEKKTFLFAVLRAHRTRAQLGDLFNVFNQKGKSGR